MSGHAAVNYSELLSKLNASLEGALAKKEYHRLLELDTAVRKCASEAVQACDENPDLKRSIAPKLELLIGTYKKVSSACEQKSNSLKQELQQAKKSQKGAQNYLSIAGKTL